MTNQWHLRHKQPLGHMADQGRDKQHSGRQDKKKAGLQTGKGEQGRKQKADEEIGQGLQGREGRESRAENWAEEGDCSCTQGECRLICSTFVQKAGPHCANYDDIICRLFQCALALPGSYTTTT